MRVPFPTGGGVVDFNSYIESAFAYDSIMSEIVNEEIDDLFADVLSEAGIKEKVKGIFTRFINFLISLKDRIVKFIKSLIKKTEEMEEAIEKEADAPPITGKYEVPKAQAASPDKGPDILSKVSPYNQKNKMNYKPEKPQISASSKQEKKEEPKQAAAKPKEEKKEEKPSIPSTFPVRLAYMKTAVAECNAVVQRLSEMIDNTMTHVGMFARFQGPGYSIEKDSNRANVRNSEELNKRLAKLRDDRASHIRGISQFVRGSFTIDNYSGETVLSALENRIKVKEDVSMDLKSLEDLAHERFAKSFCATRCTIVSNRIEKNIEEAIKVLKNANKEFENATGKKPTSEMIKLINQVLHYLEQDATISTRICALMNKAFISNKKRATSELRSIRHKYKIK